MEPAFLLNVTGGCSCSGWGTVLLHMHLSHVGGFTLLCGILEKDEWAEATISGPWTEVRTQKCAESWWALGPAPAVQVPTPNHRARVPSV